MLAVILHEQLGDHAKADDTDVLVSRDAVGCALRELGYDVATLALGLDLAAAASSLERLQPAVVFNLVDTVDGTGRLNHLAPLLLERLRLPYTGVPMEGTFVTTDKLLAKTLLSASGLPTPAWASDTQVAVTTPPFPPPYIVKPLHEDASVGLDDASVVADLDAVRARMRRLHEETGGRGFVEAFIDGRELNVSLLEEADGVRLLPPAEIRFVDFPEGKPRIVGYAAKWTPATFEYENTQRTFDLQDLGDGVERRLREVCLRCWDLFGLRGYARVDVRLDRDGVPWILEVNSNPCISPDAGFPAAALRAGIPYTELVRRIVDAALRRHGESTPCSSPLSPTP